jgi:tetratricopeptide (TPR) repeat protein
MNMETTEIRKTSTRHVFAASLCVVLFVSCSSAPERPPEIFTNRNAAAGQIQMANTAASRGDYANSHLFLEEAWRIALSTDDPETRIRVRLAQGNTWYNSGDTERADAAWQAALQEAIDSNLRSLAATSRIYLARAQLAEGSPITGFTETERRARAEEAKRITLAEMGNMRGSSLYTAFAWKTLGLAEKELGNYKTAEDAILRAADLHEKERFLEDAAYDWYLIASVRSKSGNYLAALTAMYSALLFDRRAENANGLGMDWMAIGDIMVKSGDPTQAAYAYQRSADIFHAAFISQNAAIAEKKLETLKATHQ